MTVEVPSGSVVITPDMMYSEIKELVKDVHHITSLLDPSLRELHRELGEIRSAQAKAETAHAKALEGHVELHDKDIAALDKKVEKHEDVITSINKKIWIIIGAGLTLNLVAPFIAAAVL
jgi:hypothetical protein